MSKDGAADELMVADAKKLHAFSSTEFCCETFRCIILVDDALRIYTAMASVNCECIIRIEKLRNLRFRLYISGNINIQLDNFGQ